MNNASAASRIRPLVAELFGVSNAMTRPPIGCCPPRMVLSSPRAGRAGTSIAPAELGRLDRVGPFRTFVRALDEEVRRGRTGTGPRPGRGESIKRLFESYGGAPLVVNPNRAESCGRPARFFQAGGFGGGDRGDRPL